MANLLIDKGLNTAYTVTGSWDDITDMSQSVTIAGTGSVVILMMSLQPQLTDDDECAFYRFTHDGNPVGPVLSSWAEALDGGSGRTLYYALDGLSAGSHTFAVQAENRSGTVVIDTGYTRAFQCIEIETGAKLLVDVESQLAATAPTPTPAAITGLDDTQTTAANSIHIWLCGVQIDDLVNDSVDFRFALDGTREGPATSSWTSNTDKCDGMMVAYVTDNISAGSHAFSMHWVVRNSNPVADTSVIRTLQVIEVDSDVANLRVDVESIETGLTPASYADVPSLSGTAVIDSTDSVVLMFGNVTLAANLRETADFRFEVGTTLEGAEMSGFARSAGGGGFVTTVAMGRAITGESGSTDIALQWQIRLATPEITANRPKTFQALDLITSGVDSSGSGSPSINPVESSGVSEVIRTATGSPSISSVESSGVSEVQRTATGSPSIAPVESSGVAKEVKPASGSPSISSIESSGVAENIKTASGSPSIKPVESSGVAKMGTAATGSPSISAVESSGVAENIKTAEGSPNILKPTSTGVAEVERTASGSPSINSIEASGVAENIKTSDGGPSISNLESSGVAEIKRTSSGSPSILNIVSSGVAKVGRSSSGSPSINPVESSGVAKVGRSSSGAPSINPVESAGVAEIKRTASGSPEIQPITAIGVAENIKTSSGSPSILSIVSSGVAKVGRSSSGSPEIQPIVASGEASIVTDGTVIVFGSFGA